MKRLLIPFAALVLLAVYWWATSQGETKSATAAQEPPTATPTTEPAAARAPSATPVPAKAAVAAPGTPADKWGAAIAALEERRKAGEELPSPMQPYEGLPRTDLQDVNGRPYHVMGVTAVPRDRYTSAMGKLFLEHHGFAVVEPDKAGPAWESVIFHRDARPVLVNPSGRLAIVTGTLLVKVRDLASVADIAEHEKMEVITQDESINTAYLRAPEGYAVLEGQKRLQTDARVERVEVELFQTVHGTN